MAQADQRRQKKSLVFGKGLKVSGTLVAGGGTSVIHDNVNQGQGLTEVSALRGVSQAGETIVRIDGEVEAGNAQIDQNYSVAISYNTNKAAQNQEASQIFYRRIQAKDESVARFSEDLQALARPCNFSELEEKLKNQFVYGLRHPQIKEKLQNEPPPTFDRAVRIAMEIEDQGRTWSEDRPGRLSPATSDIASSHR